MKKLFLLCILTLIISCQNNQSKQQKQDPAFNMQSSALFTPNTDSILCEMKNTDSGEKISAEITEFSEDGYGDAQNEEALDELYGFNVSVDYSLDENNNLEEATLNIAIHDDNDDVEYLDCEFSSQSEDAQVCDEYIVLYKDLDDDIGTVYNVSCSIQHPE